METIEHLPRVKQMSKTRDLTSGDMHQKPSYLDDKRFVTLEQLVEIFPFLKKSRVYYLTTTKGIPFYRVGRSLVFETGEVQHWIESGRVPIASQTACGAAK
jgi:hypothetical protein